jgi:hypothetical protein
MLLQKLRTLYLMKNFNLIIDGGNGSIKAVLINGTELLESVVIPSLLRFTPDCDYVRGGAKFYVDEQSHSSFVLGWDNANRSGAIVIGDDSEGKIKYLPQILGGTVSALVHHLPVNSTLNVVVMTLNLNHKQAIEDAVKTLANLVVDGVHLKLKPVLENVLPEGFGCSSYAASQLKDDSEFVVFDLGSGTANLSTYYKGKASAFPRRQSFEFQPSGIRVLEEFLVEELRASTSNGRVDRKLMKHALVSNTYRLLTSFDGQNIRPQVDRAIEQWLATPEMKSLLNQVVFLLQTGGAVCVCGGGWKLNAVKEAIEVLVLGNAPVEKWLVPADSHLLGALGVAQLLMKDHAIKMEAKANERKRKSTKGNNDGETTEDQHIQNTAGSDNGVGTLVGE